MMLCIIIVFIISVMMVFDGMFSVSSGRNVVCVLVLLVVLGVVIFLIRFELNFLGVFEMCFFIE